MTIRKYAKECGVEIVGKLRRYDTPDHAPWEPADRCYVDDVGNEFTICADGSILIVTADGAVI